MISHHFAHRQHAAQALRIAMACIGALACSSVEPRTNSPVHVTVGQEAELISYPSTRGLTATVPLTIQNTSATTIWYNLCGNALEHRTDAGWQEVWAQVCALPAGSQPGGTPVGKEIAPGEELTAEISVMTWLGQGWSEPLSGEYRLRLGLFDARGALAVETRISAPFQFQIQTR